MIASKAGRSESFRTRFRMGVGDSPEAHEIPDDLLRHDSVAMVVTPDDLRLSSPKTLTVVELRSERDLTIFRTIYSHSIRIGGCAPGWEITYAQEFNMTTDAKHFPPLEQWEAKGYRPDVFGRWSGPLDSTSVSSLRRARILWNSLRHLGRLMDVLHFPRKPIGEQAPADEISPSHLRGRKLSQPGSVR